MKSEQKLELAQLIDRHTNGEGVAQTAIDQLRFFRMVQPSPKLPTVYQPSLCFVVQGEKEVLLGGRLYRYAASDYLMVSVDLPLVSQVIGASAEEPYLCLQLNIDPLLLGEVISQTGRGAGAERSTGCGLFIGQVDQTLADCLIRLARLLDAPRDVPLLSQMVIREIYYRLLESEHGDTIVRLASPGGYMQRIVQVIQAMKSDITRRLRVEDMAAMANMSPSSFHTHFKAVTAQSPLQYHKRLRLLEARRLMLADAADAADAAYRVGYGSASQFSREYSRMFGAPPMTDIARLRAGAAPTAAR